jgi:hypothetical protein
MDDDIYCRCSTSQPPLTPTSSDPSSTAVTILPRQTTSALNNNLTASPKKISYDNFTPYLSSVPPSGRKRQSKLTAVSHTPTSFSDSSVTILPPLNIHQQQLHHPSYRKSARKSSGRHHTVPVIVAATPTKSQSGNFSAKRAHSAANAYDEGGVMPANLEGHNGRRPHHRGGASRKHKSGTNADKVSILLMTNSSGSFSDNFFLCRFMDKLYF